MVPSPNVRSDNLISSILEKAERMALRKPPPLPWIPKIGSNWDAAMINAAAPVNPVITGSDMKSRRKPENEK